MSRPRSGPQWMREGWAPAGPGACRCPVCGAKVNTNALARASHKKVCQPPEPRRPPPETT